MAESIIKKLRARSGQSLVEVLIAISIGSLIIGVAVGAISLTLKSDVRNVSVSFAIPLAKDLIDKVRSISGGNWASLYNQTKGTNSYVVRDGSLKIISGIEGLLGDDIQNGLLAHLKFDESSGTTAYDSSDNNNKGTLTNSPTRTLSCIVASCLSFDDVNDYVNIPTLTYGNDFTASVWFKGSSQTPSDWNYWIMGSARLEFGTFGNGIVFKDNGAVGTPSVNGGTTFLDNNWHQAVGVIRSNVMEIWVDGILRATRSDYPTGQTHTNENHKIGGNAGVRYWGGSLDDVRIYNRALSAAEVAQLYNSKIYTRAIVIENVNRVNCGRGDISSSPPGASCTAGTEVLDDPSTQRVTVSIGFAEGNPIQMTEYLARLRNDVTRITDWSDEDRYSSQSGVDTNTPGEIKLFQ